MADYVKIALLGGGAFGVALSKLAAAKAEHVSLWCRDALACQHINSHHFHPHKLSSIMLPSNIEATLDLAHALNEAQVVILALPLEALDEVLLKARRHINSDALVVSTAKGIAPDTLYLPQDIIFHTLPFAIANRSCYLSGPSFAIELAMGLPTALTLASNDAEAAYKFQKRFAIPNCRLYYSADVVGVCVGGALKNVIAIAAGACNELRLGKNAQASLITRGLAEMARLAKKMGGQVETLMGLSGVGDLLLSATDGMSRNYTLGALLGQGYNMASSLEQIGGVVEGAKTARAVVPLMEKFAVDLPISHTVYKVLYEDLPCLEAISALLGRELKDELE